MAEERVSGYLRSLELPGELRQVPQANVGFVGLDARNNDTHRLVLETFTGARKADRLSIHYSVVPADKEFPPAKAKRTTYEWFLPKGIIKRRWMRKHLLDLPSVVIIFFDLDWSDPAWAEKASECSSRVKAIRAALTSHQTRLAVVLIQKAASGDDPLAADRAAELCHVCDLPPKSLWVLPATDHLPQYAMRLEGAFHELAQTYYQQRVKTVRGHRELLTKSHHQALFVRHQFKLAFFSEIRQDVTVAYKAYQQAYAHLLELRTTDLTLCEIKVVAAMLSFKVCRLAFRQNLPRDAIAHFRRHVELFRARVGPAELTTEHCGWMAQQYQWFGEVFDQAVQMGLPAIQTQHPGIYFEQAAHHSRQRRSAAEKLQLTMADYPSEEDPLAALTTTEFYGQRPWRPPGRNVELMDAEKEECGVRAIQVMECCISHHNLVIPLLSGAISHYKQYRCPRMKERLLVQMADEYALSGDHDKAVILLGRVLQLYRAERWRSLVSRVASAGLRAAYAACRPNAYLTMAAAMLSCRLEEPEKARIEANVHSLLRCEAPEPEPSCAAVAGWSDALADSEPLLLELAQPDSLLSCRAAFTANTYQQACPLQVQIELRNLTSAALHVASACVAVSGRSASVPAGGALSAGERRLLDVTIPARLAELGTVVWLEAVTVVLGERPATVVEAQWKPCLGDEHTNQIMFGSRQRALAAEGGLWAAVVARPARLTLSPEHRPPALVGEVYPLAVAVTCDDQGPEVTQIGVDVALTAADDDTAKNTFVIVGETSHCLSEPVTVPCGDLAAGGCTQLQLGIQCLTANARNLQLTARYTEAVPTTADTPEAGQGEDGGCQGRVVLALPLEVVQPFQVSLRPLSASLEPTDTVAAGQMLLMLAQVTNTGPHAVRLRSTQLQMDESLYSVCDEPDPSAADRSEEGAGDAELSGLLRELQLQPAEAASECVPVDAREDAGSAAVAQPGSYTIVWNRVSEDARPVSTVYPSPAVSVLRAPLLVTLQLPAYGVVRRPLVARYTVHNRAATVCCLLVHLEASEAFMYAGHTRYQLRVAPGGRRTLEYRLYPLFSGCVKLPRLRLTVYKDGAPAPDCAELCETALRNLPTHVYIMPRGKGDQHDDTSGLLENDNRSV